MEGKIKAIVFIVTVVVALILLITITQLITGKPIDKLISGEDSSNTSQTDKNSNSLEEITKGVLSQNLQK